MTPTLQGRWQTRSLLLFLLGVPITMGFGQYYQAHRTALLLLMCVLVFGWVWDILYHGLQQLRWDHDWPALFQFLAGIIEGVSLWLLLQYTSLAQILQIPLPLTSTNGLTFSQFAAHYFSVWLAVFIASHSLMRVAFPRWRYQGGNWLS